MSDLVIPDLSEFQGTVDWHALVSGGYPAAIIRAHNGSRADYQWSANRAGAHAAGVRALGIYQYLQAGHDAGAQANALCDLIGSLRPGEWAICDLEEGGGDQSARAHAWYTTVAGRLHNASSEELYSGDYFFGAHHLSAAGFSRIWVAAYSSTEPSTVHELWQFTDARHFPGVSGSNDASVFHGSVEQLLTHVSTPTPPEDDMPYTQQQLHDITKAACLEAMESQPGRDALAYANLWWLDHALAGTVPAGANAGQKGLIEDIHKLAVQLAQTPPVVAPAKP
jgi:GH25 family lysozyme M1 (1,4-beta-N-acetylmuramidase)